MESSGKVLDSGFQCLGENLYGYSGTPQVHQPQKGNKTDRKDARWIRDLFMCDMIKPSYILPPVIRNLRELIRYCVKLTNMLTADQREEPYAQLSYRFQSETGRCV